LWLEAISDKAQRANRFVELNVIEQVNDLGKTSIVQNAWQKKQQLHIHGWVYDINDGLIKDLDVTFTGIKDLHVVYHFER
jgi:carbonic anhydrase